MEPLYHRAIFERGMNNTATTSDHDHPSANFAEMWDGFEIVCRATEKGMLFLKDVQKFFRKRAQIEDSYAKDMAKLTKFEPAAPDGYVGAKLKGGWATIRTESLSHSTYHEQLATSILVQIVEPIEGLLTDLEQKYKVAAADGTKALAYYADAVVRLRKAKASYDKIGRESMDMMGGGRGGETQKVHKRAIKSAQDVIKADKEYRTAIADTNAIQRSHIIEAMPKVMAELQRVETIRIHMVKQYFFRYFSSLDALKVSSEIATIISVLQSINPDDEIAEFIARNRTPNGLDPPRPFEYEPLEQPTLSSSPSTNNGGFLGAADRDKRSSWNGLRRLGSSMNLKAKNNLSMFNCRLEDLMRAQRRVYPSLDVPYVLVVLKRKLMKMGAFQTQGIFRVPGPIIDITATKKKIEEGNYELETDNVYTLNPGVVLSNLINEKDFVQMLIEHYQPIHIDDSVETTAGTTTVVPPPSATAPVQTVPFGTKVMFSNDSPPHSPNSNSSKIIQNKDISTPSIITKSFNVPQDGSTTPVADNTTSTPSTPSRNDSPSQSKPTTPTTNSVPVYPFSPLSPFNTPAPQTRPSNPLEILSPSEVKKRSDDEYTVLQEAAKQHVTAYCAMKSSHSVFKFCNALEHYVTETLSIPRHVVLSSIERNTFISPPSLHFKAPTSLPRVSPQSLALSTPDLLRAWTSTMTMTVNRINEYLCFLGGVVMRIYAPDKLEAISTLLTEPIIITIAQIHPHADRTLSSDQAELFVQKTLELLVPLVPFDFESEANSDQSKQISKIIEIMNQKKYQLLDAHLSDEQQQVLVKEMAKQSLTIKRELDYFVETTGISVEKEKREQELVYSSDPYKNLQSVTKTYLDRIIQILRTLMMAISLDSSNMSLQIAIADQLSKLFSEL
eukprot:gene14229-16788_t